MSLKPNSASLLDSVELEINEFSDGGGNTGEAVESASRIRRINFSSRLTLSHSHVVLGLEYRLIKLLGSF